MTPTRLTSIALLACAFARLPAAAGAPGGTHAAWKSLPHVQSAIGITNCAWDGDSLCFSNDQHILRFYQGRRKSDINGTTVWLNAAPDGSVANGDWCLSATDLDLLLLALLPKQEGPLKPLRVMLDPGHGGEDDGANSKQPEVKEKDLNLALALKIGARLAGTGLQVTYTRTNDVTLALDERSRLSRQTQADLFVSVHANYAANADATGVETYVLTPSGYSGTADGSRARGWQIGNRNDYHNTLLGFSIHRHLALLDHAPDRGLKRQSFFVLRETSCPAVLLEFGFLSNPAEAQKMRSEAWQQKCAASITEGILSYARKVDALDKAVAEKRARDAEANERWRLRLAAQAAARADAQAGRAQQPSPAPAHGASAAPALSNTNMPPLELNTLIEYYATGQAE